MQTHDVHERLDTLDRRITMVENQDRIAGQLEGIQNVLREINGRLDGVDQRFTDTITELEEYYSTRHEEVMAEFRQMRADQATILRLLENRE